MLHCEIIDPQNCHFLNLFIIDTEKALLSTPLLREELFGLLALEDLLRCTIESRIYPSLHTGDHIYLS